MKMIKGNVWDAYNQDRHSMILCPCNGYLAGGKRLVMGAGFAKEVRDRFRGIDVELAWAIKAAGERINDKQPIWRYGFCNYTSGIGALQSKEHWRDVSTVEIIRYSVSVLQKRLDTDPRLIIHTPIPGIGLGGLHIDQVMPLLETLPDRVTVYRL